MPPIRGAMPVGQPGIPGKGMPPVSRGTLFRIKPHTLSEALKYPVSIMGKPAQFMLIKMRRENAPHFYIHKTIQESKGQTAAPSGQQKAQSQPAKTIVFKITQTPSNEPQNEPHQGGYITSVEILWNDWTRISPSNTDFNFGKITAEEINRLIMGVYMTERDGEYFFWINNYSADEMDVWIGEDVFSKASQEPALTASKSAIIPPIQAQAIPSKPLDLEGSDDLIDTIVNTKMGEQNARFILDAAAKPNILKEAVRKNLATVERDGAYIKASALIDSNGEIKSFVAPENKDTEGELFRVWVLIKVKSNVPGPNFTLSFDPSVRPRQRQEDIRIKTEEALNKVQNPFIG